MAATQGAFAFGLPTTLTPLTATTFGICYVVSVSDGVSLFDLISLTFTWDTTQSVATNIANVKTAIVNLAASQNGITLTSDEVSVFSAVN